MPLPNLPPAPPLPAPLKQLLGGLRDRLDPRDRIHQPRSTTDLPATVDLRAACPPVYDQGRLASCTAQAIAGAIQFTRRKHGQDPDFVPSRLFIYWNERALAGTTASDAGASTRDGLRSVTTQGVAPESLWPYNDTPADPPGGMFPPDAPAGQQPPAAAYDVAAELKLLSYQRLRNDLTHMRACLAEGYPFTIGIVIYPSFVSADHRQQTVTPLPGADEEPLGEHVVLAVGYDDHQQWLICRNSWGETQADQGYFYLPYAYAERRALIGDLWTLRTISA